MTCTEEQAPGATFGLTELYMTCTEEQVPEATFGLTELYITWTEGQTPGCHIRPDKGVHLLD